MKETDFAELPDGSIIEMIEKPGDPTESQFAVWKDGVVSYLSEVQTDKGMLAPWPRTDPAMFHVRLAQKAEPFANITQIERLIEGVLRECLDFTFEDRLIMTAFVFATWIIERLPIAPYLAFIGPPGSGKTTAMRVLDLFCYRSFLTSEISSAGFYDLSHRMRPTLLLDETLTAGRPRELTHLLKSTSTPGFVSLRKGKASLGYGPKVFSWVYPPDDAALNSRCIMLTAVKSARRNLISPNDPKIVKMGALVRQLLLQFRFEYLHKPSFLPASEMDLSGRLLDLYRALAAPFNEDKGMRDFLAVQIATRHDRQTDLLSAGQMAVLRALYRYVHAGHAGYPSLASITQAANAELRMHNELTQVTPRKVGTILTSLSFPQRVRANDGYYIWLERADNKRLHHIARQYSIGQHVDACDLCAETSQSAHVNGENKDLSVAPGSAEHPPMQAVISNSRREHSERSEGRNDEEPVTVNTAVARKG